MMKIVRDTMTAGALVCLALATAACQPTTTNTMSTNTVTTNMIEPTGSVEPPAAMNTTNAMAAPTMSEAERRDYMRRHGVGFAGTDTNSDGRITREEAMVYARGPLTSGGDSDGDGAMSAAELARANPEVRAALLRRDADGDGAVSSAEIDARVDATFRATDTNRDGGITEAEYDAAVAAAQR